jgi:hypothetical protein
MTRDGALAGGLVDDSGKAFEFTSHWTATCQKVGGERLIVRAHKSLEPFHNPMLEHAVRNLLLKSAGAAALIGLLLGAAMVWLRYRLKAGAPAVSR